MWIKQDSSEFLNKTFGDLFVLEESGYKNRMRLVKCKCVCGVIKIYPLARLKNGDIVSCGCRIRRLTIERNTKHGQSKTKLYRVWEGMNERCNNINHESYAHYGGKGVTVCPEWKDFANFFNWAVSAGYKAGLSIDRYPDIDGNYEPNNCRWANATQQMRNMSTNRIVEYNGQKKCIAEWAEIVGLRAGLIYDRLNKLGWDIHKTFTTPPKSVKHVA
jgi:hypothetical protein